MNTTKTKTATISVITMNNAEKSLVTTNLVPCPNSITISSKPQVATANMVGLAL